MSTPGTPQESPTLKQLYRELAGAHVAEQDLAAQGPKLREQITAREQELQARRGETDDGTQDAQRIDQELQQLSEAWAMTEPDEDEDTD